MIEKSQLKDHKFFLLFLSGLVALAPLSMDMYMPAMARMASDFGVSYAEVNLTMSAYLLGNAIGQFFGGSLSDQLGRRRVGLIGLVIFFLSSLMIIAAPNIETMQVLRLFQAVGGGFAMVICIAQVRDIFPAKEVLKRYANVVLIMLIAPMVAPSIGAILVLIDWHAIFWFLAVFSFCMLLIYFFYIPETRSITRDRVNVGELFSSHWKVMNHRVNGRLTGIRFVLYSGFSSGVFMCFLTNASMIFMNHYKLSEFQFAIGFALVGVGMILGNRLSVYSSDRVNAIIWMRSATSVQVLATALLVVLSYAGLQTLWTATVLAFIIIAMSGAIMPAASARYITYFDDLAGSAASLSTTVVFSFGAIFGALAAVLSQHGIIMVFITMLISSITSLAVLMTIHVVDQDSHA